MSACAQSVGRIARFKNWAGSVGVNGSYVRIASWNEQTSEFSAKILQTHEIVTVLSSQLELNTADEFSARFPNASVVHGLGLGREWPCGVTIDFSHCQGSVPSDALDVTINGSCRVVGEVTSPEDTNACTGMAFNILVETVNEDDIVEFEHLHFDQSSLGVAQKIVCSRGKVVFRHCSFDGSSFGLIVGVDQTSKPNVTLESCTFSRHRECGLMVHCGRVTLVDCTFHDVGVSVCVKEGAFLVANHCQFTSSVNGIVCPNGGKALLYGCRFTHMYTSGVQVSNGSRVHMDNCFFVECLQGAMVNSSNKSVSHLAVVGSKFLSSQVGLTIGNGRVSAKVARTNFTACFVGMFVAIDTRGIVALTSNKASETTTPFLDLGGAKCTICMESPNLTEPPQVTRVAEARVVLTTTPALLSSAPLTATVRKVLKAASVMSNRCDNCGTAELPLECFKKCAACKEARYCSRACQKVHFRSVHEAQCKEVLMRFRITAAQGYIACAHCHSIELQTQPESYCGDLRGFEKFYCTARCRSEHDAEL